MITPAQRAEIRRLYYGEHWKMGTIAAQLGLHRETVRAAVEHETGGVHRGVCRPSALDPYLPLLRNTLAQYPRLRATRIHEMVRQRGYSGSVIQVRRLVRRLRPESTRTVYRRVVTLVAEQAQVDWGSFGKIRIGHGMRAVSGFVMVLGYSRAIAALFTLDQTLESFLRGHVDAFDALGGVATTSPTADATPTSRTVPSPTSGPKSSPASCRSPPIPSRPNSSAPSALAKPPTSASTAMPTRFPTPTSASRSRCSPAPPASASSTDRPSSPAIAAATTPDRPSRTPSIWKGSSEVAPISWTG